MELSTTAASVIEGPRPRADLQTIPTVNPATGARPSGRRWGRRLRWDIALVCLVCLLAFLLASFPLRSSVFWQHLAAGRQIVAGQGALDAEPSTDAAVSPINHSWLFDVLLYFLYPELVGGAGLIVLKALLVVGLAVVVLHTAIIGKHLWIASLSSAVALILLAPWLDVQPALVSMLLLGLIVALLERGSRSAVAPSFLAFAGMGALLAVLWVNLDQWFILAPLAVSIYLLGLFLPGAGRGKTGPSAEVRAERWRLCGLLLVVVAACIVNPHHVFVFRTAADLVTSPKTTPIREDAFSYGHLAGPVQESPLPGNLAATSARAAYWCLVVLGVLSFVLNRERWHWGRTLLWLGLFGASTHYREIVPLFAVAGSIIMALNFGEFYTATLQVPQWHAFVLRAGPAGQLLVTIALFALIALSWTGMLQPWPVGPRSWEVPQEHSLRLAGEQIAQWRSHGRLEGRRAFLFSPELANYFAWYSPQEKGLVHSHARNTDEHVEDYIALREGLVGNRSQDPEWQDIMRRHGFGYVVLHSNDQRLVEAAVMRLLPDKREWVLLFWKGRTVIFGWQDPQRSGPGLADMRLTPIQTAFAFGDCETAPATWPGKDPHPYRWWDAFWKSQDYRSAEVDEACLALTMFDALKQHNEESLTRPWNYLVYAGYVGLGGTHAFYAEELARFGAASSKANLLWNLFLESRDAGPRSAPYLAVRAARRALRANPDNPLAHLLLGEAYHRLWSATQEKIWVKNYSSFGKLRTVQMITCYRHALALKPDLELAHQRLAELFQMLDFKDLALKHLEEYLELAGRREPEFGDVKKRSRLKKIAARREAQLKRLQDEYEINSTNLKVGDRARLAGDRGLAFLALSNLLNDDVSAFGTAGMDLELKLLLLTGETEKVRLWMEAEQEKVLPAYRWNKVQLDAALGDYEQADADLRAMIVKPKVGEMEISIRSAWGFALGQAVLDYNDSLFFESPNGLLSNLGALPPGYHALLPGRGGTQSALALMSQGLNQQANVAVLRGLLALEAGHTARADALFRQAIAFWNSVTGRFFEHDRESTYGRAIARDCLQTLAQANRSR